MAALDIGASDTSVFEEAAKVLADLQAGAAATQEFIGKAQNIIGGTRCVHGQDVTPAGVIKDIPTWADLCDPYGAGSHGVQHGFSVGIETPDQWKAIGRLDPVSGIAPQGTSLIDMTPAQQRAWIANSAAISIAQNVGDLKGYRPTWDKLNAAMSTLGWIDWVSEWPALRGEWGPEAKARQLQAGTTGIDPDTGRPMFITNTDINAALSRLSAPDIKSVSLPGAEFGEAIMTTAAVTAMPGGAELQNCLTLPFGQRSDCVTDVLKRNPDLATYHQGMKKPWKEVIDPAKILQGARGLNDKHYTVLKVGKQHYAVQSMYIAGGLAVAGVGSALVAGTGIILLFATKGGKKFRKKAFKKLGFA